MPEETDGDGGLALRQALRRVKERMEAGAYRRDHGRKTLCNECLEQRTAKPSVNIRAYRLWSELRGHLIDHHGYDRLIVPE